ncbi:MAG: ribonuclease P protein component, partial [Candidatus Bipolaricaulota bacterium]
MVDNSFPKGNRLRGGKEFSRVYKEGEKHERDNFVFYLLERDGEEPRIGIVTPKSLGTAVERNRIKRIIRENFRKNKRTFDGY